jgi:heme oxygenase (staphylobilin-producing)
MFIAVTRIAAPAEALDRMAEAFRKAAPDLKQFNGFLGFELWRDTQTLQAVSRWESRAAMETYTRSGLFGAHHGGAAGVQAHGEGQAHAQTQTSAQGGAASAASAAYYEAEVVV